MLQFQIHPFSGITMAKKNEEAGLLRGQRDQELEIFYPVEKCFITEIEFLRKNSISVIKHFSTG